MTIKFGLTDELVNTQFAPLAAIFAHYQQNLTLEPLENVRIPVKTRDFSPFDKLTQVLLSIFAGCRTLSEVNSRLRSEVGLAKIWHWERIADQSSLSRTLDALTLTNIEQLREASVAIWRSRSLAANHDWRGYLWLDFDLSGLPCGKQAQMSQKGYFSGKKTSLAVSWRGSAPFATAKPFGPGCFRATSIRCDAFNPRCWQPKKL